jgi:hypothetical protein
MTMPEMLVLALIKVFRVGLGSEEGGQNLRNAGVEFGAFETKLLVGRGKSVALVLTGC